MTQIMGILNVTPDSFSGDGVVNLEAIVAQTIHMQVDGAHIIDIGAESTRPGARPLTEAQELARLIPAIRAVKAAVDVEISVDTYKATTAQAAVETGANIINDVSGGSPEMFEVARLTRAKLVVSHNAGGAANLHAPANLPKYSRVSAVAGWLWCATQRAQHAGVREDQIIIDPGIGFGKTAAESLKLLCGLHKLRKSHYPMLVGCSRKGFLGKLTGQSDPTQRDYATAVTVAQCVYQLVDIVRVHNVAAARDAIAVANFLKSH